MCLILLENLMDSYKKILIDSFKDFLVDQARQFQNTPNFRIDSFRFFGHIFTPGYICFKIADYNHVGSTTNFNTKNNQMLSLFFWKLFLHNILFFRTIYDFAYMTYSDLPRGAVNMTTHIVQ